MHAVNIGPEFGKENLKFVDTEKPQPKHGEVLVRITKAGLNPIDYNLIHGKIVYNMKPIPHIPGSEAIGAVETDGSLFKKGDQVMIFNRIFDGTCDMCRSHREHLCRHGGIWGVVTNGAYTQYVSVPEKNLFLIPENLNHDVAVSLPIGGLTSYRSLIRAGARPGDTILIYGASGNTGIFASQLASMMGLEVYGVSRKDWVKNYGCSTVFKPGDVPSDFKADIVINSLGADFWKESITHVAVGGRIVSFGVLTGREAALDIAHLYTSEIGIIGSTGGSLEDLSRLLKLSETHEFKAPVATRIKLMQLGRALDEYEKIRDGRIVIEVS
jgi:alcohol dehydrogenase